MHIEQEIKTIIMGLGIRYIHLIDDFGLNALLPQLTEDRTPFVVNYVSAGSTFDIDQYDRRKETSQIQMILGDIVPFTGAEDQIGETETIVTDADNVETISETMKTRVHQIIGALNVSGKFEPVKRYRTRTFPLRFDAFCTCVTLTFDLKEKEGTCTIGEVFDNQTGEGE